MVVEPYIWWSAVQANFPLSLSTSLPAIYICIYVFKRIPQNLTAVAFELLLWKEVTVSMSSQMDPEAPSRKADSPDSQDGLLAGNWF